MPLPDFHVSAPFTLGIELELQVINPPGYDLCQDSSALIAAASRGVAQGEIKHDITNSMLEVATGVCDDIHQAATQLAAIQRAVLRAASEQHVKICGGGTHPFQRWQSQEVGDNPRYQHTLEAYGYLARQATVFGQHVHVGCTNGDDALYLLHGLSRYVPHLIALSAASPYLQGADSSFACARLNIFSAFPDNGPMPWAANWQEFTRLFRQLSYTSMVDSIKDLHWDIRPSPHFGTVEVRVMDTPLTLGHAVNMAGLMQALAHWLLDKRPHKVSPQDYLLYKFNRFQACRYGLQGVVTDVASGEQRTIASELETLLEQLQPYADVHRAGSALEELALMVKHGKSEAQRMREFIAGGGSLISLVQQHCDTWAA